MTVILQPGEGQYMSLLGNEITSKVVSGDTGGALWVAEYVVGPKFAGPPAHIHNQMLEIFYVLDGTITCRVGDQVVEFPPGGFGLVSPGTLHTFSNPGDHLGKFLVICSPGGLEGYFNELPDLIAKHGYPPPPEVMQSLLGRYDMVFPPQPGH